MSDLKKRRRRGERSDGRIQVTYTDGRNPDGSARRVSFYGSTRAEAERKREEYKARKRYGITAPEELTVDEWLTKWIELYNINTARYNSCIKRMRKDLGSLRLSAVVEANLIKSLRDNYEGLSASAASKYKQIMQQVFKKARVNRLITWDPAEDLQLPKTATPTGHRALERWEIDLLTSSWQESRAGLWAMIMLLAGLRRGELIALDWSNVDLNAKVLTVAQTAVLTNNAATIEDRAKSRAGLRQIPLCATLCNALETVPKEMRKGPVALSDKGARLTAMAFKSAWETLNRTLTAIHAGESPHKPGRRAVSLGPAPVSVVVRAHDLRHTFATLLYDGGVDVKSASYLLGHADTKITLEIYTHLSQEKKTRTAAALIGILDGIKSP